MTKPAPLLPQKRKRLLDLGTPKTISRIDYFPWNDGNFVVPAMITNWLIGIKTDGEL